MNKFQIQSNEEIYAEIHNVTILEVRVTIFDNVKMTKNGSTHTLLITSDRIVFIPTEEWSKISGMAMKLIAGVTGIKGKRNVEMLLRHEGYDLYGYKEIPMSKENCAVFCYHTSELTNGDFYMDMEIIRNKAPHFRTIPHPHIAVSFESRSDCALAEEAMKKRGISDASKYYSMDE